MSNFQSFNSLCFDSKHKPNQLLSVQPLTFEGAFKDVYIIRIQDSSKRYFHGLNIPGATYNSFLFKHNATEWTLIDSCKEEFSDIYIATITRIVEDLSNLTRIIIQHSEWDRSSAVADIYNCCPNAAIFGGENCLKAMKKFYPSLANARFVTFKNGHQEELESGFVQTFVPTPLLHWAESTMTLLTDKESNQSILFSCDTFSTYLHQEACFVDEFKDKYGEQHFNNSIIEYFASLFSCYRVAVKQFLGKFKTFHNVVAIANGSGPIFRKQEDIDSVLALYNDMANYKKTERLISILYDTNFNSTAISCEVLANQLRMHGYQVYIYRLSAYENLAWAKSVLFSEAVVLACATVNNTYQPFVAAAVTYLGSLDLFKKTPVAILTHYGWNGHICAKKLEKLLSEYDVTQICEPLGVQWRADDADLEKIHEFAKTIITQLKKSDE